MNKSFQMKQRQHKTRMAGMGQAIDSQEVYVGKLVEEQKRFESMRRGYVHLGRDGGVGREKRGMGMNEKRDKRGA